MKSKRGFTLIELLVVISIIALLLSIIMPSLNKAKELAKRAVDSSTVRQWGIATATYCSDNNSFYPGRFVSKHPTLNGTLQWGWVNQYYKCRQEGWLYFNLVDIFLRPYGDIKFLWSPSVPHGEDVKSWDDLIADAHAKAGSSTWGMVTGDYGFFVGYTPDQDLLYRQTGNVVIWGPSMKLPTPPHYQNARTGFIAPLRNTSAKSSMAVTGTYVRYYGNLWYYGKHQSGTPEAPDGMVGCFNDGSAAWVQLDKITPFHSYDTGAAQAWYWPDPWR